MTRNQAPRGTRDLFPAEIPIWDRIEALARNLFQLYGYREIRPPLLEETSLFVRSIGEATDIVEKEMFSVKREDSSYTFRPEGTAGVVRAYLEAHLDKTKPFQKFFYIGPMFRYERPQKGRERQFTQFGIEALGSMDPLLDAEAVHLAARFFEELGLDKLEIRLNSMGDYEDRERFRKILHDFLSPMIKTYCQQCQARLQRNIFRVLDCKVPADIEKNKKAPRLLDHLGPTTKQHFAQVQQGLQKLNRPVTLDPYTVRGLDYYTRTVFEIHDPQLGARSALCGGGRYDYLISELGGPELGAMGFAIGLSATLIAMQGRGVLPPAEEKPLQVFLVVQDDGNRLDALHWAEQLRRQGITADFVHEAGKSVRSQLRTANSVKANIVLFCGPSKIGIKNMADGDQVELPIAAADRIIHEVKNRLA